MNLIQSRGAFGQATALSHTVSLWELQTLRPWTRVCQRPRRADSKFNPDRLKGTRCWRLGLRSSSFPRSTLLMIVVSFYPKLKVSVGEQEARYDRQFLTLE